MCALFKYQLWKIHIIKTGKGYNSIIRVLYVVKVKEYV